MPEAPKPQPTVSVVVPVHTPLADDQADATDTPTVSVIVAAYGQEEFLAEALDSLQAMTLTDWEAIVVDDGSPDAVMEIAASYAATDHRIRLLHTENHGVGAARNSAAATARGRYITFLDGDDLFYPDYLRQAADILDAEPNVTLVYGHWEYFGATTDTVPIKWHCYGALLLGNTIHVSSVIRRKDFLAVDGFDTSIPSHEDWELWIRLLKGRPDNAVRFLPDPVLRYRQKASSRNADSLGSDLYGQVANCIHAKHTAIYNSIFNSLIVSPKLIYMGGVKGDYRWTALRPITYLSDSQLLDSAIAFTNLLDFLKRKRVLSQQDYTRLSKSGMLRFKGRRLMIIRSLPFTVALRFFRRMLIP